jgi:hypothetical protein
VIECELRRLRCSHCRTVRLEAVPWARPGSPYGLSNGRLEGLNSKTAIAASASTAPQRSSRSSTSALGGVIEPPR